MQPKQNQTETNRKAVTESWTNKIEPEPRRDKRTSIEGKRTPLEKLLHVLEQHRMLVFWAVKNSPQDKF